VEDINNCSHLLQIRRAGTVRIFFIILVIGTRASIICCLSVGWEAFLLLYLSNLSRIYVLEVKYWLLGACAFKLLFELCAVHGEKKSKNSPVIDFE
jgi:hypothetical protein